MRETTIARNYAETLLALARKAGDLRGWGGMITDVANAVENDRRLRIFLESPRVDAAAKNEVLGKAFQDRMPRLFVRYLQALVTHRRQMLIPQIAHEYRDLVDEAEGRMHANVTVASEPDADTRAVVARELSRSFGRDVVPHFAVDARILGGLVVRVGDTVLNGSVQRRLERLRGRMATGHG
jgi:F-type H+-transporting ATPase subunit delta